MFGVGTGPGEEGGRGSVVKQKEEEGGRGKGDTEEGLSAGRPRRRSSCRAGMRRPTDRRAHHRRTPPSLHPHTLPRRRTPPREAHRTPVQARSARRTSRLGDGRPRPSARRRTPSSARCAPSSTEERRTARRPANSATRRMPQSSGSTFSGPPHRRRCRRSRPRRSRLRPRRTPRSRSSAAGGASSTLDWSNTPRGPLTLHTSARLRCPLLLRRSGRGRARGRGRTALDPTEGARGR